MSEPFATKDYWERRLRDHFSLEGVGYLRLGRRFNEWMYRVRGEVFDRVVDDLSLPAACSVLDVGSGTGFYIERWLRRTDKVTGVDLTEVAVTNLSATFRQARFVLANIGKPLASPLNQEPGSFDVVSAFDVLFHIVDDQEYALALHNIASLLKPRGLFVWSDNFIHQPTVRVAHQVSRSLDESTAALDAAGFEVVGRVPMFVVMNYPADTTSRLTKWAWTAMMAPAMASDLVGGLLGWLLFPLERRLVRKGTESPSTELMICRRRP